ncbi:MAG: histidine kinase [Agriterribacter sp.]
MKSALDVYFLVFAAIFLFIILIVFVLAFFSQYRKKLRSYLLLEQVHKEQLMQTQFETQEQAFTVISQELHDSIAQTLSLAKIQVSILKDRNELDVSMLSEVTENITSAMSDIRNLSHSIDSDRLRTISIISSLSHEIKRVNKCQRTRAVLKVYGDERPMEPKKKLLLFRMVQESLQNVIKHAAASYVSIELNFKEQLLHAAIADNGRGFDYKGEKTGIKGSGLRNIRTRALLGGGNCSVISSANQGTTILLDIPYE